MNATLPSKTSLKQYQEAITTLETKKSLTAQSASIKQERFDLGQRLSQLQRKARNIMDELGGYESNSARYANEIESLKDELQNVTSEIDSITQEDIRTASALIDVEQKVATTNKVVTPITLQIHRDKLATERAKLEKLAEHRDKLEMEQCGELTSELETEWQDLLARQAVGEEVKQRLEEVFSQLSQQQAAHASKAASTKSTLAGLDRMIAATEASIATLDKQHDGLSAMFWRDKVITAADDYEQLSAQTASALMRIQAMVTLLGDYDPTAKSGLDLSNLQRAHLPSLTRGTNWLDYDNHLAPYCDRQNDFRSTLKALEEGAHE